MKWSEFKAIVDDALAGQDPEIDYIDVSRPCEDHNYCKFDIVDEEGLAIFN